jgi:hypothetical protein
MTSPPAPRAPQPERAKLHRYTITSEGASLGYFRLVEDPEGAWLQWPEVERLLTEVEALRAELKRLDWSDVDVEKLRHN